MTTVDQLREQHERSENRSVRSALRNKARALAAKLEQPSPEWAQPRRAGGSPPRIRHTRAPEPVQRPASVEVSVDIPDALRRWARRVEGAVIQISQSGVILHTLSAKQVFPDVAAAIAAVQ